MRVLTLGAPRRTKLVGEGTLILGLQYVYTMTHTAPPKHTIQVQHCQNTTRHLHFVRLASSRFLLVGVTCVWMPDRTSVRFSHQLPHMEVHTTRHYQAAAGTIFSTDRSLSVASGRGETGAVGDWVNIRNMVMLGDGSHTWPTIK